MTKKILLALAALTALTLCFSSCKKDNNKPTPKSEVKLRVEPKEIKVIVGQTAELTVTVQPADTKCTFETANADIATVSDKGVITGVKVGKTVITVKAGDATPKTVDVEVIEASTIDESRLLGKVLPQKMEEMRELFAPFYAPIFTKMKEQEPIVKAANEAEKWEFFKYTGNKDYLNSSIYTCRVPFKGEGDNAKPIDGRLIAQIVYAYGDEVGGPWMACFFLPYSDILFDEDPVVDPNTASDKQKESMKVCQTILMAYGFTESAHLIQYVDKQKNPTNVGLALYKTGLEGGSLQGVIMGEKHDDGKYGLSIEITQREPQKEASSMRSASELKTQYISSDLKKFQAR
ncbi:Ig-like domain-containing protein [uncultured Porphyromonas sp.]|uniref:Ig-like domain-containing protein n=1 Tax=uncultured Porphyromonas sp. TaxID=159274 RepID=UPI0025F9E12B|nr:Ig-like domain-containing protein [uncultured Porphyromonas sp.]